MRGITRREVVAGGTGILLLQPGTVFSAAANSTVGVGIIGTGDRGQYVGGHMGRDGRARWSGISGAKFRQEDGLILVEPCARSWTAEWI